MASVRENLIAARALIEKGERINPLNAIRDSVAGESNRTEAYLKLREALPDDHEYVMRWLKGARPAQPDIIALFDRAIAAQDPAALTPQTSREG